jgi:hypothetical protein
LKHFVGDASNNEELNNTFASNNEELENNVTIGL